MGPFTLTTSWVLPVSGPPVRDGRVVVEGGRIARVDPAGDASAAGPTRDLGPGVLLPGLVNAHCHLELSHLHGAAPLGEGFVPWVEGLVTARARSGDEEAARATASALASLEERGTAAVGDVSNRLAHLHLLAASRLRAVVFLEVLAWDPARAEETERWIDERLSVVREEEWGGEVRLAAHAPHSVSPVVLRRLVAREGLGALHLAESPEESRFLQSGDGPWAEFLARRGLGDVSFRPPGMSPVRYADALGLLRSGLVAAHGVHLNAADREILARRGVAVVLCPRSNRNLGVGQADVPALLEAGVPLCLGTDSLASVDTLDVLDDAVLLSQQFPDLDPAVIVRLATAGGAAALGFDELGTLAPGKAAALAFAAAATPPEEPHAFLLSGEARLQRVEVE